MIRESRIPNSMMQLRPQDLLVLFKTAIHNGQRWTYAALADALAMSASEVHASVRRSATAGLIAMHQRGIWAPVVPALLEFAVHGVRYVWPAVPGPVRRGIPTSFGAPPLSSHILAAPAEWPVWPWPTGDGKGPSVSPLYRSVPEAALADQALYRLLALQDAIRIGRARERALAAELIHKELERPHVD